MKPAKKDPASRLQQLVGNCQSQLFNSNSIDEQYFELLFLQIMYLTHNQLYNNPPAYLTFETFWKYKLQIVVRSTFVLQDTRHYPSAFN